MMARTFSSPTAFRQALERRLKTLAERRAVPLNTLRLKFLIERLLARLFAQPNPPWLLKGGYAMELRYRPNARTTKDIDLTVNVDEGVASVKDRLDRVRDELQAAAAIDLGDHLNFLVAASRTELVGAPQGGARFPVKARMAGRLFGSFHIDVGIGDALHGAPERLQGEDLLAFAGIAPAEVLAIGAQYSQILLRSTTLFQTLGHRSDRWEVVAFCRAAHLVDHRTENLEILVGEGFLQASDPLGQTPDKLLDQLSHISIVGMLADG